MKEKCPVEKLLRVDRKKRVEKKNQRPELRRAPDQGKEELRRQEVNCDSEAHYANGIPKEDSGEEWPDVAQLSELRKVERRVTPEEEKCQERGDKEVRNWQVGDAAVIDEQRNNYKNDGKLDG